MTTKVVIVSLSKSPAAIGVEDSSGILPDTTGPRSWMDVMLASDPAHEPADDMADEDDARLDELKRQIDK